MDSKPNFGSMRQRLLDQSSLITERRQAINSEKQQETQRKQAYFEGVTRENPKFTKTMELPRFESVRVRGRVEALDWNPVSGENLLLLGKSNTGKTFVAESIHSFCGGIKYLEGVTQIGEEIAEPRYRGISTMLVQPNRLIEQMSSNYFSSKQIIVAKMESVDVLVIDGLGHEKAGHDSFWQSSLLAILDLRLKNSRLKTIVTTHLSKGELTVMYREAIASRLTGVGFTKLLFE